MFALAVCSQRWGSVGFGKYVRCLEGQADEVLQAASEAERWVLDGRRV